jgi:hypothetical protein
MPCHLSTDAILRHVRVVRSIRMKHTTLTNYATATLDATGWTTVYQANEPQGSTGWRNFVFSAPFEYNGIDNLLIDFSHNNSSYTSDDEVRVTDTGSNRTVWARSDSGFGDPLTWSGTTSPAVAGSNNVPNVRLTMDSTRVPVSISPSVSGNFVDGVWTGYVTVNEPAMGMFLRADIGAGRMGDSNAFDAESVQFAAPVLDELPETSIGTSRTITWAAVADADEYYVEYATRETFATPLGNSGWITP